MTRGIVSRLRSYLCGDRNYVAQLEDERDYLRELLRRAYVRPEPAARPGPPVAHDGPSEPTSTAAVVDGAVVDTAQARTPGKGHEWLA